MDFILIDWTRMGKSYCLAGAIFQAGSYRIVRPIPHTAKKSIHPNVGWSPYLMDGHARWEVFQLQRPEPATTAAPHREDIWVRNLERQRRTASREQRQAILQATLAQPEQPLFGAQLDTSRDSAWMPPGKGDRSLTSVLVPSRDIQFKVVWRDGCDEPDYRVLLPLPDLGVRILPVKDHLLLTCAEEQTNDVEARVAHLRTAIRAMGEQVLVRLGLSRPFTYERTAPRCWLMADGFFSLEDPQ